MPEGNRYTGPGNTGLSSLDVVADFYPRLQASSELAWWNQLAMKSDTPNSSTSEYTWLGQAPVMTEWIGGRLERELPKFTYSIVNKMFESTIPVSLTDLRRDRTGQIRQRVSELATRTVTFPNKLISTLITNGEAGVSGLGYDGQFFFDTDHGESGTSQTNDLTATEIPAANVSNADAITSDEAAAIVTQVAAYLQFYTDNEGEPINQDLSQMTIMSGNANYSAAILAAINAELLSAGGTNPVPFSGMTYRVISNPRLSGTADKLYFFASGDIAPFILQEEVPVQTQMLGEGSDEEFKNDRHIFGVKWVGNAGYGFWQRSALVTLS